MIITVIIALALPALFKCETPSSFTCTVTCPQCDCAVPSNEACNTTAIEDLINELVQSTQANTNKISKVKRVLNKFQNTSYNSGGVLNDLLLLTEELIAIHNVTTTASSPLPKSCLEIKERVSTSPSGVYLIVTPTNTTQYVYCHMETLCGADGGWTRLAHIDMTDTMDTCPGGLRLYEQDDVRACGRPDSQNGGCSSIQYPSYGVKYSEICGRVRGYQYNSPDALYDYHSIGENDINSPYVDGVSLTRGNPRKHVWTFIAGINEDNSKNLGWNVCPCQIGSKTQSNYIFQLFEKDYYCESGNPSTTPGTMPLLYTADPLWDGEQCEGLESPCCNSTSLPWFHKLLDVSTSDYIEMRVCADQSTADEDTPIDQLEVFVK